MPNEFVLQKFDGGMHFITLDSNTVSVLTRDGNKRAICRLNDELDLHCAVISRKQGGHFINVGLAVCKKLKIKKGSKLTATFSVDTTPYQFNMPEEFKEVLETDPEANHLFHSLTAGNQRGLIYLVTQVKSSEKKIERALKIAERIKGGVPSPRAILISLR